MYTTLSTDRGIHGIWSLRQHLEVLFWLDYSFTRVIRAADLRHNIPVGLRPEIFFHAVVRTWR